MPSSNNNYQSYGSLASKTTESSMQNFSNEPSKVIKIKDFEHRNILINDKVKRLTIVDNYTEWCGPCKAVAPKYESLASKENFAKVVNFCKEDAEAGIPGGKPVTGVPAFHFYFDGKFMENLTVHGADIENVYKNMMLFLKIENEVPIPLPDTDKKDEKMEVETTKPQKVNVKL
jgi:thiol-disulfide isomerase/thioredoxin